jgi:hypothetical protein
MVLALFRAWRVKPQRDDRLFPSKGLRFVPGLACNFQRDDRRLPGIISQIAPGSPWFHNRATILALFLIWRVTPPQDDRPLPGNGLRFVPGLACNTSAGRSATSKQYFVGPQADLKMVRRGSARGWVRHPFACREQRPGCRAPPGHPTLSVRPGRPATPRNIGCRLWGVK